MSSVTFPSFGTFAPAHWQRHVISLTRRLPETWMGRRLALWLRKPLLVSLGSRPVDVEVMGFRIRLHPHDNVSERRVLTTPQFFDSDELNLLARLLRPGFQFVDIGANAGLYSLFVAARTQADPTARILAIEAQPEMLARLHTNIALNGFSAIQVAPCAVADRSGTIRFHLSRDNRGQASLVPGRTAGLPGNIGAEDPPVLDVPCRPLLDLMDAAGITRPDALKIDIEGAEDLVLGHFLRTAPNTRWPRVLFMERNNARWKEDIVSLCRQAGYREQAGGRMNLILSRKDDIT